MREWSRALILIAAAAVLTACASRAPSTLARIDHRSPTTAPSQSFDAACAPGSQYRVRSGDTASEIAERCNISLSALASANGLRAPYALRAGQTLTLPGPSVHIVQRGENLYRIGLRYGLDFRDLAAHNGLRAPYELEVGQEIRLPNGADVVRTASNDRPPQRASGGSPPPPRQAPPRTGPPTLPDNDPPPPAASGPVTFAWPLRGEVISDFGPKPDGRRNDGINIRASEGDSVRASAAGQVVYAGNELAGYGELVLIRHAGGWVTAYAHNSRLRVAEGEQVTAGQIIAEAGSTGTVDSPQLHFEIRRGVTPEDPMRHLPGS